jgi:hypothetical protein
MGREQGAEDTESEDRVVSSSSESRKRFFVTRSDAMLALGVSSSRLRAFELTGDLRPYRFTEHGRPVIKYAPAQIRSLLARRRGSDWDTTPGAVAQRVFAAFAEGRNLRSIVVDYGVSPERVRELWAEYQAPLGTTPARAPSRSGEAESGTFVRADAAPDAAPVKRRFGARSTRKGAKHQTRTVVDVPDSVTADRILAETEAARLADRMRVRREDDRELLDEPDDPTDYDEPSLDAAGRVRP